MPRTIPHLTVLLLLAAPAYAQEPTFRDITSEAGVSFVHQSATDWSGMGVGTGAAWFDYDNDGDLDLYVTQGAGPNQLFRNDHGTFTDVAQLLGADDPHHKGAAVAAADFDNDGWTDLYLGNSDEDALLRNLQGQGFQDVLEAVDLIGKTNNRTTSVSWGDYNLDGYLDLYLAHHLNLQSGNTQHQDRLFLNDAGQRFVDVSDLLGRSLLTGYGFIGGWSDFDNDGDPDLLVVNDCGFQMDFSPFRLFRNRGGTDPLQWLFDERGLQQGFGVCENGMGIAIGDYDRNGWMDYFVSNIGQETLLFHNQAGQFSNRAAEAGVFAIDPAGAELWSWGASFLDYDLDGWLDLYVAAGVVFLGQSSDDHPQPNLLFRNRGDGTFDNASTSSGLAHPGRSRTTVTGDFDGDGDPDLALVNNNESLVLYRNEQNTGHSWLIVDLQGAGPPLSNRSAIGARITLTQSDNTRQYAEIRSGSSLGGSDDLAAYFGLGETTDPVTLHIRWPSGIEHILPDVTLNQRLRIEEPSTGVPIETPQPVPTVESTFEAYPNPFVKQLTIVPRQTLRDNVDLTVFDLLGRNVHQQTLPPGHRATWGEDAPAGTYLVRLHHPGSPPSTRIVIKQ